MKKYLTIFWLIFACVSDTNAHPFIYDIKDKEERSYTLRPKGYGLEGWNEQQAYEDRRGIHQLNKDHLRHAASTGEHAYLRSEIDDAAPEFSLEKFSWMRRILTQKGSIIEQEWVIQDPSSGKIVGELSYGENESTILVHPEHRGRDLAKRCPPVIMEYFKAHLHEPHVKVDYVGDDFSFLYKPYSSITEFERDLLTVIRLDVVPYEGFFGVISLGNVPSLKAALSLRKYQSLSPASRNSVGVVFPPQEEDPEFRRLVERCVQSDKDERVKAEMEFSTKYSAMFLEDDVPPEASEGK